MGVAGVHRFPRLSFGWIAFLAVVAWRSPVWGTPETVRVVTVSPAVPGWLAPAAVGLAGMVAIGLTFLVTLRRQVRTRNEALSRQRADLMVENGARLKAEAQLRQAQRMQAIGQLVEGTARDFNDVLTLVQNSAANLLAGADADARQELGRIQAAARRGAELTEKLLAVSSMQRSRPRVVSMDSVLRRLEPLLSRTLPADVSVVFRAGTEVPDVKVDAGQMEQVILNLTINARDAMPNGGVLRLITERIESDGTDGLEQGVHARVTIEDTGIGMDEVTLAHALDPFFTTKGDRGGTGLGLAAAHGIVKQAGGVFKVASRWGEGTTVMVTLPGVTDLPKVVVPSRTPGSEVPLIVLANRDHELRRSLADTLARYGYQVSEAETAQEAAEQVKSDMRNVDLLVVDDVLPGMSAGRLVGQLRDHGFSAPVLATGHAGSDEPVEGAAFMTKPFGPGAFVSRVRVALGESRP